VEISKKMKKSILKKLGLMFAVIVLLVTASVMMLACRGDVEVRISTPQNFQGESVRNFSVRHGDRYLAARIDPHNIRDGQTLVISWNDEDVVVNQAFLYVNGLRVDDATSPHSLTINGNTTIQVRVVGVTNAALYNAIRFSNFVYENLPRHQTIDDIDVYGDIIREARIMFNNLSVAARNLVQANYIQILVNAENRFDEIFRINETIETIRIFNSIPTMNMGHVVQLNNAINSLNGLLHIQNEVPQTYIQLLNNSIYRFREMEFFFLINELPSIGSLEYNHLPTIERIREIFTNQLNNNQREYIEENTAIFERYTALLNEIPFLTELNVVVGIMQQINELPRVGLDINNPIAGDISRNDTETVRNIRNQINALENDEMVSLIINYQDFVNAETRINELNQTFTVSVSVQGSFARIFNDGVQIINNSQVFRNTVLLIEPFISENQWIHLVNVNGVVNNNPELIYENGSIFVVIRVDNTTINIDEVVINITQRIIESVPKQIVTINEQGTGIKSVSITGDLRQGNHDIDFREELEITITVEEGYRGYIYINGAVVKSGLFGTDITFTHEVVINTTIILVAHRVERFFFNVESQVDNVSVTALVDGVRREIQSGDYIRIGATVDFSWRNSQTRTNLLIFGENYFTHSRGIVFDGESRATIISLLNTTILSAENFRDSFNRGTRDLVTFGDISYNEFGAVVFSFVGLVFYIEAGSIENPLTIFYFETEQRARESANYLVGNNYYVIKDNMLFVGNNHGVWVASNFEDIGSIDNAFSQREDSFVDLLEIFLEDIGIELQFVGTGSNENIFVTMSRENSITTFGGVENIYFSVRFFSNERWAISAFRQPQFLVAQHTTGTPQAGNRVVHFKEVQHSALVENMIVTSNSPSLVDIVRDALFGTIGNSPQALTNEQNDFNNNFRDQLVSQFDSVYELTRHNHFEIFRNIELDGNFATAVFFTDSQQATRFLNVRINTDGEVQSSDIRFIRVGNFIIFGDDFVSSRVAIVLREMQAGAVQGAPQVSINVDMALIDSVVITNGAGAPVVNGTSAMLGDTLTIMWTNPANFVVTPYGVGFNFETFVGGGRIVIDANENIAITFEREDIFTNANRVRAEEIAESFQELGFTTRIFFDETFAGVEATGILFGEDVFVRISNIGASPFVFGTNNAAIHVANELLANRVAVIEDIIPATVATEISEIVAELNRHGFVWGEIETRGDLNLGGMTLTEHRDVWVLQTAPGLAYSDEFDIFNVNLTIRVYASTAMANISAMPTRVGRVALSGSFELVNIVESFLSDNAIPQDQIRAGINDSQREYFEEVRDILIEEGFNVSGELDLTHFCFARIVVTGFQGTAIAITFASNPPSNFASEYELAIIRGNIAIFGDAAMVGHILGAFGESSHASFSATYNLTIPTVNMANFVHFRIERVGGGVVNQSGQQRAGSTFRVVWETRRGFANGMLNVFETNFLGNVGLNVRYFTLTQDATPILTANANETVQVTLTIPNSARLATVTFNGVGVSLTNPGTRTIRVGEQVIIAWQSRPGYFVEVFIGGTRISAEGGARTIASSVAITVMGAVTVSLQANPISMPTGFWQVTGFDVGDRFNFAGGAGQFINTDEDGFFSFVRGLFRLSNEENNMGFNEEQIYAQTRAYVEQYMSLAFHYNNGFMTLTQRDRAAQRVPLRLGEGNQWLRNNTRETLHELNTSLYFSAQGFSEASGTRRLRMYHDTQTAQLIIQSSVFNYRYAVELSFFTANTAGSYSFDLVETSEGMFDETADIREFFETSLTNEVIGGNRQAINIIRGETQENEHSSQAVARIAQAMTDLYENMTVTIAGSNITVVADGITFTSPFSLEHYHGTMFLINATNIGEFAPNVELSFGFDAAFRAIFVQSNLFDYKVWLAMEISIESRWTTPTSMFQWLYLAGQSQQTLEQILNDTRLNIVPGGEIYNLFRRMAVLEIYQSTDGFLGMRNEDGRIVWFVWWQQGTPDVVSGLWGTIGNIASARFQTQNEIRLNLIVGGYGVTVDGERRNFIELRLVRST